MSRIETLFSGLKEKKEAALVGFVTAGDPNLEKSTEMVIAMCKAGLDVLELGIPFSDPTADGPVIQRSSKRSLDSGMKVSKVLEMTGEIRRETDIPIILFSYYNPLLAYGNKEFYEDSLKAGADGLLVVDLPPEESEEMTMHWGEKDFSLIRLVAPTTPKERMKKIADTGSGFLYLVSKTGVTGSDGLDTGGISDHVQTLKSVSSLPICVGFGISTPEDVAAIASTCEGVVIGSAFERLIEENIDNPDLVSIMEERVKTYKKATIL